MRNKVPTDSDRLEHIADAIDAIQMFTTNITREEFLVDERIQSAVLYQFIIIGEAVANLSLEILEKYPYTWHKPRSFRNYIAHEYFGIKMWMVWNAIIEQLPELKTLITDIRNQL
ncbi:MAG: HepT-like ribonuclease domain-containing protein [Bacteroidota bacterium]